MKSLIIFTLCAALAVLPSCQSTGGNSTVLTQITISYAVAKHLSGAKNASNYAKRQSELALLATVLASVNGSGLDAAAVQALIVKEFPGNLEVQLLASLAIAYFAPNGGEPKSALLTQIIATLNAAATAANPFQ